MNGVQYEAGCGLQLVGCELLYPKISLLVEQSVLGRVHFHSNGGFAMPISGPTSYVSTTEAFLTHWAACDTSLGAGNEIVVSGNVNRAGLQTLLNNLSTKRTEVQADLTDEEIAREDVELQKAALHLRINQFNERVRGVLSGTKWERALPLVPTISEAQSKFTDPLEKAATLWLRLNADPATPAPLVLQGGYTRAQFAADIAALKTAYTTWNAAVTNAKISLEERNDIQDLIYAVLKDYRSAMPSYFTKGHALIDSLPDLTPKPGSTPAGVTINVVWDPVLLMARITWSLSSAADLYQYEIRFCAGPNYDTDTENVIGNVSPSAPREFLSDAGLAAAGNVASFKVYVITNTLNEKGSNAVSVTRP